MDNDLKKRHDEIILAVDMGLISFFEYLDLQQEINIELEARELLKKNHSLVKEKVNN